MQLIFPIIKLVFKNFILVIFLSIGIKILKNQVHLIIQIFKLNFHLILLWVIFYIQMSNININLVILVVFTDLISL